LKKSGKNLTTETLIELNNWDSAFTKLPVELNSGDFMKLFNEAKSKFSLAVYPSIDYYEWDKRKRHLSELYSGQYEKKRKEKEEKNRINSIEEKKRNILLNNQRIKELSVDELKQELALASRENYWDQKHSSTSEEQLRAKKEAFKASRSSLPREELIKILLSIPYDDRQPLRVSNHGKGVKRENNAKEHEILGKNIRLGKIPLPQWENENLNSSNEEKNAVLHIKNIYKGALCDSEGFYQHSGEC